jgi:outer membrane protein assembly factor BamB
LLLAATLAGACGSKGDAGGWELPDTAGKSVGYQVDLAHSGYQPLSTLHPPLTRQWTLPVGDLVSYPVVADGRVFVAVKNNLGNDTNLSAVNVDTGEVLWGPVAIPGWHGWSAAGYEAGRLFVLSDAGFLGAFEAATGRTVWTVQVADLVPAAYVFDSPPAVAAGTLFISGTGIGGTVLAIAADTGRLRWQVPVTSGTNSCPAIGADAIFVSSGCEEVSALDPRDGSSLWTTAGKCTSLGGTPVINDDRLWVVGPTWPQYENTNTVFDRHAGTAIRLFEADRLPAFAGQQGFFVKGGTLTAVDHDTDGVDWTFKLDDNFMAPLVANGHVYVVSGGDGVLHAIAVASGREVWSDKVSDFIPAVSYGVTWIGYALAADEHHLIVPGRTELVAYR